ncbi:MAG: SDR family oxidoreductase [Deferribacteres bacterium]|nr:SDR family oxidoreductase [candidate division KSB1 bacterium]MCB9502368.1 SDR family oxidoreductase [Deferribacteres bacterium]
MNNPVPFVFDEKTALPGLAGKYGVVTGSTKGMGLVIARLLVECGARVVINGREEQRVQQISEEINTTSPDATLPCPADTSDFNQVQALFNETRRWSKGKIDFLVCNAGHPIDDTLWHTPLHSLDENQIRSGFEKIRKVDLDGARYCAREALRTMLPQNSGSLVFISSTPALTGYHGTPYTEAKAAILGLMRDLAREYARYQIRSNALALGNIRSGWYDHLSDEEKKTIALESPSNRWGNQREVAGAVAFLLSDLAGYINGQTIVVDGGKVIH